MISLSKINFVSRSGITEAGSHPQKKDYEPTSMGRTCERSITLPTTSMHDT